ncbi:MAG TPA: MFS transporter, partial [Anaerolineae bacterium]|nr:MFS transporter [Anaerolineae bacterium]
MTHVVGDGGFEVHMRERFKNIDKRLITILLIVFVQMVGASMVVPLLPLYAKRVFALEPQIITLLITTFFAAQFAAGPTIGRLSDRYGRLPVLIVSQIGTVFSFLMLAFAPNVETLFLSRLLDGITGGNIIVAQAYITDISPPKRRTQYLGFIFAAFGLGFMFGPAVGGILAGFFGVRIPFILASIAATLTVLLTWYTLDESLTAEQRMANRNYKKGGMAWRAVIKNQPLMIVLALAFVGQFVLGLVQATFALYGEAVLFVGYSNQITDIGIGVLLAFFGVGQLLTQSLFLQPLLERFGETRLVIMGSVLRGIGMFIYAVIATPWLGAVASIIFAVGMGLMMPSLQGLATQTVDEEVRGG